MNKTTKISIAIIGGEIALAATFALGGPQMTGTAYADTPATDTVLAEDLPNADALPVCALEDCSDVPNSVGLWQDKDTGNWWLSLGRYSALVIDDTE
jgi:hypothetical protein